jgi:PAS domain S-box-containing protein
MRGTWLKYETLIKGKLLPRATGNELDLHFWQDQLFATFLTCCLPVSLIALIPCLIMSLHLQMFAIAAVDLLAFLLLIAIAFANKLSLRIKKMGVVFVFYLLAIFLINALGFLGPGVFYLFFITVLIALILPTRYAYVSIGINTASLGVFALIIKFGLFNSALSTQYTPGEWIAFGSNLVFASIVIVALIHKIFEKLQTTIVNKTQLKMRYKSIFDGSPLPMWIFDTETLAFLDVNEAAIKHYGYTREEFLGMTIRDIRSGGSVEALERLVNINKASGKYYEGTSQHRKKSGERIYVKVASNPLQFDNKAARLVLVTDMTEQVEYQLEIFNINREVKESESYLRAVFDNSVAGFVLLDDKCIIKLFNPRTYDLIRFNKDQQMFETGRSIFDFIERPKLAYFKGAVAKVLQGEVIEYDRMYTDTAGENTWVHYILTPVYQEQQIVGVCITGRDITEHKQYLQAVETQNKTLREIAWMQSHLVRAPLARILGLLPLIEIAQDDAEQEEIHKFLLLAANELDDIILKISEKSYEIIDKYPAPVNG